MSLYLRALATSHPITEDAIFQGAAIARTSKRDRSVLWAGARLGREIVVLERCAQATRRRANSPPLWRRGRLSGANTSAARLSTPRGVSQQHHSLTAVRSRDRIANRVDNRYIQMNISVYQPSRPGLKASTAKSHRLSQSPAR